MRTELVQEFLRFQVNHPELDMNSLRHLTVAGMMLDHAETEVHLRGLGRLPQSLEEATKNIVAVINALPVPPRDKMNLQRRIYIALGLRDWQEEQKRWIDEQRRTSGQSMGS